MHSVPTIRCVHPSEALMYFPLFQIPPISKNFLTFSGKFYRFYLFPKKIFRFSSAKISDFFTTKFPLFSLFHCISPYFVKNIVSPYMYFKNVSLCFRKIYVILHTLYVFRIPLL